MTDDGELEEMGKVAENEGFAPATSRSQSSCDWSGQINSIQDTAHSRVELVRL
jgi:hypothetical protein